MTGHCSRMQSLHNHRAIINHPWSDQRHRVVGGFSPVMILGETRYEYRNNRQIARLSRSEEVTISNCMALSPMKQLIRWVAARRARGPKIQEMGRKLNQELFVRVVPRGSCRSLSESCVG